MSGPPETQRPGGHQGEGTAETTSRDDAPTRKRRQRVKLPTIGPPMYQRAAAATQSMPKFYEAPLAALGLHASMQDALWFSEDGTLSTDPARLAVALRRPEAEVLEWLPHVVPFFDWSIPGRVQDIGLSEQMERLLERRAVMVEAGIKGNLRRWGNRSGDRSSDPAGDGPGDRSLNTTQHNPTQLVGTGHVSPVVDDPWIKDLERAEGKHP